MARQYTADQTNAIEARNGSVLVSAAAGSGKTAVLVERVIRRICDPLNPCDADRLLIVTFTKAAAGEMRERIAASINARLRENPEDRNLRRQQVLLSNAKICTIDSFCSSLVRENFERLDVSPDFKTIDEAQQTVLRTQAVSVVLEKLYDSGDRDFLSLAGLFYSGRDDNALSSVIFKLYDASRAYPFPEKWLDGLAESFRNCLPPEKTVYGEAVLTHVISAMDYCQHILNSMKSITAASPELEKNFERCISSDSAQVVSIRELAKKGEWDTVFKGIVGFEFVTKGRVPKDCKDSDVDKALTEKRKQVKEDIIRRLPEIMCCRAEEYMDDMTALSSPVSALVEAVKLFSREFGRLKLEQGAVDFADIELMALSLLVKETEDGYEKTDLAGEISKNYEEILIDEYQDTNEAQDMLFTALSKDASNLFRVGDVKQSIYSFRQAMPEIFLKLRESYFDFDGSTYPARINLDCNFRSREGVTQAINYVFSQLMSRNCGDLDYDRKESLVPRASYEPASTPEAELHLVKLDRDSELTKDMQQASYIASLIENMLTEGITVKDGDGQRPLRLGDICVLMRSMAGRGVIYADEFRRRGIAAFTEASTDFFGATEVSTVLSLLRVIDNPRQDVPLLAAMLSPIFGFTPDEAALLRTEAQGDCLYTRAVCLADRGSIKYKDFIDTLNRMRLISATLCTHELIRRLYDETGYFAAVQVMSEGKKRRANLLLLLDYAASYEAAGYIGLTGFIRFIDRLDSKEKTLSGTAALPDTADVVRIMTIHKSKGLEFPVCIIANCAGQFNRQDEKGVFVLSPTHGIGLKRRDINTLAQHETLSRTATKLLINKGAMSEEMRILYVAMTRAREKLITVTALKDAEKTLKSLSQGISPKRMTIPSFCVGMAKSYSDWLLTAYLRHPDSGELRKLAGVNDDIVLPADFSLKVSIAAPEPFSADTAGRQQEASADAELLSMISHRLSYSYRYSPLAGIITKRAASHMGQRGLEREYFASSRPAFMDKSGLTAAQRGTATHRFMELCDYERAEKSLEGEIALLVEGGYLSKEEGECISPEQIEGFFRSSLYERIKKSETVYREKRFMIEIPLREVYPELPTYVEERQLVQGVCDCAFVEDGAIVLVDYKTDNVESGETLRERYLSQLEIYKRALEECLEMPVKETILWSFSLNCEC